MYPHFTDIAVTDTELAQLLEPQLSGPSTKFMEAGLGILSLDAGKYIASCAGDVPSRILAYLEATGASGSTLINHFSKPPYGYPADVISACLAGLLRANKIRIRPEEGPEITSVRDPGVKDLFRKVKEGLGRADIFPAHETEVSPRDRIAICKFFEERLDLNLDRENDAIADAVFAQFPKRREALRHIESRLSRLPGRPEPPAALGKLGRALEACMRTRQVEEIVIAVKQNLDQLRDGLEQLAIYNAELTDDILAVVLKAADVRDHHIKQLREVCEQGEVGAAVEALEAHLKHQRPWRDIQELEPALNVIRARYGEVRGHLMTLQSEQVEQALGRLKTRDDFEKLNADQSHLVLRPIEGVITVTDAESLFPSLAELKNGFASRLLAAEDHANELLDQELSKLGKVDVIKVPDNIRGRELTNVKQLEALLKELDERLRPLIASGKRVRLV
jgi:hypothetical protein